MGYRFGIDHFYFTPEGLLLIETLLPRYLKIHVTTLEASVEASERFATSMHHIAATYGVALIAIGVQTQQQSDFVGGLGIQMMQGEAIAPRTLLQKARRR
ncbi:MAG: EAL domain-containing protein [Campylobacterales bacterium]|nr:EAL domain-containing protein [Campylobacterales bacterium]